MSDFPISLPGAKHETLMWAYEHEVEPQALNQLRNIAALEWVHGLRVMPDVHLGKGATVGSVIAMEQAISPSAVGVDIGCGVNAVRTSLTRSDLNDLDLIFLRHNIEKTVPVGNYDFGKVKSDHGADVAGKIAPGQVSKLWSRFKDLNGKVKDLESRAGHQLGTLGGGNHFIELCVNEADQSIWITLHSGSRNIGKTLAEIHINVAKTLPQNQDLPDKDLAVFFRNTPEMEAYLFDLHWAQDYAMVSRTVMLELIKRELHSYFASLNIDVKFDQEINAHHNYVSEEEIDGKQMLVTRKGAISARKGDMALIPGSMGTGSYIVRGLGNPKSFQSASHGAGRRMSRGEAKRRFTVEDLIEQTKGIESRKDQAIVDEIPSAYKDLHSVIEAQKDLVEPIAHLQTLLCVKG